MLETKECCFFVVICGSLPESRLSRNMKIKLATFSCLHVKQSNLTQLNFKNSFRNKRRITCKKTDHILNSTFISFMALHWYWTADVYCIVLLLLHCTILYTRMLNMMTIGSSTSPTTMRFLWEKIPKLSVKLNRNIQSPSAQLLQCGLVVCIVNFLHQQKVQGWRKREKTAVSVHVGVRGQNPTKVECWVL